MPRCCMDASGALDMTATRVLLLVYIKLQVVTLPAVFQGTAQRKNFEKERKKRMRVRRKVRGGEW